jgi:hypothetical protein
MASTSPSISPSLSPSVSPSASLSPSQSPSISFSVSPSALEVNIGGVDFTDAIVFNTVRKVDILNNQMDSLQFTTRKYGSLTLTPAVNEEVVFYLSNDKIFGGVIVRIDERTIGNGIIEYDVTCNDYSQYLKREIVTERYTNKTAKEIIDDIVTNHASGFTTTNVQTGPTLASISFNRVTVADCLQKLAKAIGYAWYVDYDRDIHFFAKNDELAPFNLEDGSNNYIDDSIIIVEDISQLKNAVLVQGSEIESTTTRTETIIADGTNDQYKLANKFSVTPVVEVNAAPVTVGLEYIDLDGSYDCMWNYNEKYIRFTAGNVPADTDVIEVTATYRYPIVLQLSSGPSVIQFGLYEFAITDKTIKTQDEAFARAQAELEAYQNQLYSGEFRTYVSGLRSGQVININSIKRTKNIDVLIQSVEMKFLDPDGSLVEYIVKFASMYNVGIIEFLQKQLLKDEVIVDDSETLLSAVSLSDTGVFSDSITPEASTSPPYVYGPDAGNVGTWNFATWG